MSGPERAIVVAGLKREAALLAGCDVQVVLSGGDRVALQRRLDAVDPASVSAVVSFGLAGALDPNLPVGTIIVPDAVIALATRTPPEQAGAQEPRQLGRSGSIPTSLGMSEVSHPTSWVIRDAWRSRLSEAGINAGSGTLLGVDRPFLTAADKAAQHRATGALAVDMESHVAAAYAVAHQIRFGVLRVVSDAASHDLPPIVATLMRPDGGIYLGRLAAGLLRDPRQIAGLIATGRDAGRAFAVLRRVRGLLGERLGLHL